MFQEINLLASLPKSNRKVLDRKSSKTSAVIQISRQYGREYFDGDRSYGYGGYEYDGRWLSVAKDIVSHFGLKAGNRILDVGCAKGFLVHDLAIVCPGLEIFGLDISEYALKNCKPEIADRLYLGCATRLPFPNNSFDAVISINTIHNLDRAQALKALMEIERLAPRRGFVQVDSYHNEEQKFFFESWVLTAKYYDYPSGWLDLFKEAGYTGDYFWTIIN